MTGLGSSADLAGRKLGDFVVREKIGEGGFGEIYLADQPTLGREVVVKVIHQGRASQADMTERFLREARLASRLEHPYAAHVYAFGVEADGLRWLAMERVRGTPLSEVLAASGPVPLDQLVPLFERVCEVVHTAHEQGIVHRDIKPSNVMVITRAGRLLPKLLDLGIAKLLKETDASDGAQPEGVGEPAAGVTGAGGILGSPAYMGPEVWADPARAGPRSDIYALGVLAYEALTGQVPFTAPSFMGLLRAHARSPVPALPAGFPAELGAVISRAMAKRQDDRYSSALELGAAFRAASGITTQAMSLPRLPEALVKAVLTGAPQPLAEAVTALEAARSPHQAVGALWECVRQAAHVLGLLMLVSRTRVGPGPGADRDSDAIRELLLALARRDLGDSEWLELGRALGRPFARRPEMHPLSEVVTLLGSGEGAKPWDGLLELRQAWLAPGRRTEDQALETLGRGVEELSRLLSALEFLARYPLAVSRGGTWGESWMGVRRKQRGLMVLDGDEVPAGQVVLCDREGKLVLALGPLFQIQSPSPGAEEELFMFTGPGRNGARLRAMPVGFEHEDEGVWSWFREKLMDIPDAADGRRPADTAPYLGLKTFSAEDASFYFGREREIEMFVNRLRVEPLVAVVGPSGAGKSSFVQAGVGPKLPAHWRMMTVRPGPTPIAALAAGLERQGLHAADLAQELLEYPGTLGVHLRATALSQNQMLVVVVDQFEELFTLCADAAERVRYVEALVRAARSQDDPVRVILTLRDDFLMRGMELPALKERLARELVLLTTPDSEDLLRIVTEPARRLGYQFDDPELPQEMVHVVRTEPGALALLSFTAAKLWELRDRHFQRLPRKAYEALGGVGGALAQHAEDTLAQMSSEERHLVREAFGHLVTAEGTRAVLTRPEFLQVLGGSAAAEAVLEKLLSARLLSASQAEGGTDRVEIIHEALLSAWPRLVEWRREDAEGARLRDQLRQAVRQWDERGHVRGLLWRDEALLELKVWRSRYPGKLTDLEETFVRASLAQAAAGRRIRRGLVMAAFVALAAVLTVVLVQNRATRRERARAEGNAEQAELSRKEAVAQTAALLHEQGREAMLKEKVMEAFAYLFEAEKLGAQGPALDYLVARASFFLGAERVTLAGHEKAVNCAIFTPDGRQVITTSNDGTARVWNAADGKIVRSLAAGAPMWFPGISRDGRFLCTPLVVGERGAMLWDLTSGQARTIAEGQNVWICSFSPDGSQVLTTGELAVPRLWEVATGKVTAELVGHRGIAGMGWFSEDGRMIVTSGSDGTARLWDAQGKPGPVLAGLHEADVMSAISPDGRRVATGSWDGTAALWDGRTGRLVSRLSGHTNQIRWIRFSPDGRLVATASADRSARIWDGDQGRLRFTLPHQSVVISVAFSRDGSRLLTTTSSGQVDLWDPARGLRVLSLIGHGDDVISGEFSPDGASVVTASEDKTARLWDARRSEVLRVMDAGSGSVAKVAVNERGTIVAATSSGQVSSWDFPSGEKVSSFSLAGKVMAIDETGGRLLAATKDTGIVVDATSGMSRLVLPGPIKVGAITEAEVLTAHRDGTVHVYAHDGKLIQAHTSASEPTACVLGTPGAVIGTTDGMVRLYERGRTEAVWEIQAHQAPVTSMDLSPDGGRLLTTSADSTGKVWDLAKRIQVTSLEGHSSSVSAGRFIAGSDLVATVGHDGSARIWTGQDGRLLAVTQLDRGALGAVFEEAENDGALISLAAHGSGAESWMVVGGTQGRVLVWAAAQARPATDAIEWLRTCRVPWDIRGSGQLMSRELPESCRDL